MYSVQTYISPEHPPCHKVVSWSVGKLEPMTWVALGSHALQGTKCWEVTDELSP